MALDPKRRISTRGPADGAAAELADDSYRGTAKPNPYVGPSRTAHLADTDKDPYAGYSKTGWKDGVYNAEAHIEMGRRASMKHSGGEAGRLSREIARSHFDSGGNFYHDPVGSAGAPAAGPKPRMPTEITDRPDGMIPQVAPRMPRLSLPTPTREQAKTVGEGQDIPGVSGRLRGLLSRTSPYVQRARTSAAQAANRRGLLNTSIAAGAGEAAAIDAALPIAQADAAIAADERGRVSQEFMQARDHRVQQLMQDRGFGHEAAMAHFQRDFAGRQAALDRATQRYMQERGLSFEESQGQANRELKQKIAVQTATERFQDQYQTSLDRLAVNVDLPAEERQRLEEHFSFLRDQAIDAIRAIYDVDLSWAESTRPPVEEAA